MFHNVFLTHHAEDVVEEELELNLEYGMSSFLKRMQRSLLMRNKRKYLNFIGILRTEVETDCGKTYSYRLEGLKERKDWFWNFWHRVKSARNIEDPHPDPKWVYLRLKMSMRLSA